MITQPNIRRNDTNYWISERTYTYNINVSTLQHFIAERKCGIVFNFMPAFCSSLVENKWIRESSLGVRSYSEQCCLFFSRNSSDAWRPLYYPSIHLFMQHNMWRFQSWWVRVQRKLLTLVYSPEFVTYLLQTDIDTAKANEQIFLHNATAKGLRLVLVW